jgi:hypothetical protein
LGGRERRERRGMEEGEREIERRNGEEEDWRPPAQAMM